jgi:hypothetical protein
MSRNGNCWENRHFTVDDLAVNDVADDTETFYNRIRRHSCVGGLSRNKSEAAQKPRSLGVH